jgi:hypothetical protein
MITLAILTGLYICLTGPAFDDGRKARDEARDYPKARRIPRP